MQGEYDEEEELEDYGEDFLNIKGQNSDTSLENLMLGNVKPPTK